jgi:serine/threonine protein kinase
MELPARIGNYEPLIELASGGMATLYLARHVSASGLERLVVMKRVHQHLLRDEEFRDMFLDEARISWLIRHPNVVQVLDVPEVKGELFLVLEYVESLSLTSLIAGANEAGERLPPRVVSRILSDTLAALHAAHETVDPCGRPLRIVHRDVTPHNIIVGTDGVSRLIDFGIAKAATHLALTNSGVLRGTFRYMSPEQLTQQPLDRRADVFAAGVVLYEALTGRGLFRAADEGDMVLTVLVSEIPAPSSEAPELRRLDPVVYQALAREKEQRFQTAQQFQHVLEESCLPAPVQQVAAIVSRFGGAVFAQRKRDLQTALARRRAPLAAVVRKGTGR